MSRDDGLGQSFELVFPLLREPDIHLLPGLVLKEPGSSEVSLTMSPPEVVGHPDVAL